MATSKWPQVQKNLKQIEAWAAQGLNEKQIASNCGCAKTAFEKYKREHPELREALKKGKKPFIEETRSALVKRALGFEFLEEKTYLKKNDDGTTTQYKEITKKYCPPNVAACAILLKNLDRDETGKSRWSDDPASLDLKREMAEFEKELRAKQVW